MAGLLALKGLSYTAFNFSALSVDTSHLPPSASGDQLQNLTINVKVTATNTGAVAGSTPVMAAYSKQTHGVGPTSCLPISSQLAFSAH